MVVVRLFLLVVCLCVTGGTTEHSEFWSEGYYRQQLLFIRQGCRSVHRKEDLLEVVVELRNCSPVTVSQLAIPGVAELLSAALGCVLAVTLEFHLGSGCQPCVAVGQIPVKSSVWMSQHCKRLVK